MAFRLQRSLLAIRSTATSTGQPFQVQVRRNLSTTPASRAAQNTDPTADLQSQATKQQNFQKASEDIGIKMQAAPQSITSEDAAYLKSREARATGQSQPPKDGISADAQRLAAENEGATKPKGVVNPAEQSVEDRVKNFESVAEEMAEKIERDPESVTKEDAGKMHSREQKAFGTTQKGGIASQVHKVADENEK